MPTYKIAADDLDRFIAIPEAAARLGISERTAYRMASDGSFPIEVHCIGGRKLVNLRRLVEHMYGGTVAVAS